MKNFILLFFFLATLVGCQSPSDDFNAELAWREFDEVFKENYAYYDNTNIELSSLFDDYKNKALEATSEQEFISVVTVFMRYFRDPHLNIYPGNKTGYSVTPTGADIWVTQQQGKYLIIDIKAGSAAYNSNIQVNSEAISIDGRTPKEAITTVFGGEFDRLSTKRKVRGLNIALGGIKNKTRKIITRYKGVDSYHQLDATYDAIKRAYKEPTLVFKTINNLGYIRFNNSLGNNDTVNAFNKAIKELITTDGLILDLRNIPSGGNTGVAEPILGHFVQQETPYQLYQRQQPSHFGQKKIPFHQAKMERATAKPKKPFYDKPFVVLVGRWTGSIGEGMMIGLDALGAKAIIGAPTADLLGGIKNITLTQSNAVIDIAYERMFHVNGTYREDFDATIKMDTADWGIDQTDPALSKAIKQLSN